MSVDAALAEKKAALGEKAKLTGAEKTVARKAGLDSASEFQNTYDQPLDAVKQKFKEDVLKRAAQDLGMTDEALAAAMAANKNFLKVAIGRHGPAISFGASGLRSNISWCGGPPTR